MSYFFVDKYSCLVHNNLFTASIQILKQMNLVRIDEEYEDRMLSFEMDCNDGIYIFYLLRWRKCDDCYILSFMFLR